LTRSSEDNKNSPTEMNAVTALAVRMTDHFGVNLLERLALRIDEERIRYETGASSQPPGAADRRRARIRDGLTTLLRLLPDEIKDTRLEGYGTLADEQTELFRQMTKTRLKPVTEKAVPWHVCAKGLAASYLLLIAPHSRISRDGPVVCFVARALYLIGAPQTITRTAIAKVLSDAGM
jgi:hypothetical protein